MFDSYCNVEPIIQNATLDKIALTTLVSQVQVLEVWFHKFKVSCEDKFIHHFIFNCSGINLFIL